MQSGDAGSSGGNGEAKGGSETEGGRSSERERRQQPREGQQRKREQQKAAEREGAGGAAHLHDSDVIAVQHFNRHRPGALGDEPVEVVPSPASFLAGAAHAGKATHVFDDAARGRG